MSRKDIHVEVEYLTRVEGHGNIVVDVKNGVLEKCELDIVESPRFFEGMLRGRSIFEAQHISSRICGICACAHTLASVQAAEDALGLVPSDQTRVLRELLLDMEILDSHLLHIYLLAAPDLLGVKSFVPLIRARGDVVRRALRMKKTCNDICDILVGRHIHPISCIAGGFTKLPGPGDLENILDLLRSLATDMDVTVDLALQLKFPVFERETVYAALVDDSADYPLLSGDIGLSDGTRFNKKDYLQLANEFIVPRSSAKLAQYKGKPYSVGALARANVNFGKLSPRARAVADAGGFKPPVINPYLNSFAQVIECVQCLHHALFITEYLLDHGVDHEELILVGLNEQRVIPVQAGTGVGAVEAPRGLLFHNYEVDHQGIIMNANCVIPTAQNVNNIEHDMRKLVPEILDNTEEEVTLALEMLVRAYDPCISCSAHMLKVSFVNKMTTALSSDVKKALLPSSQGRTVYVTVGNSLRGDDGVANYIADNLRICREDVVVVRAFDMPERIIDRAAEAQPAKTVIVDAADFGGKAGTVRSFDPPCIPGSALSTHSFPLSIIAAVLEECTGSEVTLVGIQICGADYGSPMGEPVKTSADAIVDFLNVHFRG